MDLTDIGCLGYKPLSSLCVDTCDAQKSHDGVRRDARETIGSDGTSDEGKSPVSYSRRGTSDERRRTRESGAATEIRDPRAERRDWTAYAHPLVFSLHGVLKLILLILMSKMARTGCPRLLLKL